MSYDAMAAGRVNMDLATRGGGAGFAATNEPRVFIKSHGGQ